MTLQPMIFLHIMLLPMLILPIVILPIMILPMMLDYNILLGRMSWWSPSIKSVQFKSRTKSRKDLNVEENDIENGSPINVLRFIKEKSVAKLRLFFNGPTPASFNRYFRSFQTKIITIFTTILHD